jgi:hypothetical protein
MIIAQLPDAISLALRMSQFTENQRKTAQMLRREYLLSCKATGDQFLIVKEAFKEACVDDPAVTEWGEFTSWENFLQNTKKIDAAMPSKATINKYIRLSETWHIVESLDLLHLDHCYRLNCTLEIIKWAEDSVKAGIPLPELKVKDYWLWLHGNKQKEPSKKELLSEIDVLKSQLAYAQGELERVNRKLAELSPPLEMIGGIPLRPMSMRQPVF